MRTLRLKKTSRHLQLKNKKLEWQKYLLVFRVLERHTWEIY